MGIGFTSEKEIDFDTPSWSYSGFHRFRVELAKSIGMNLNNMKGFENNKISWDEFEDDIIPLLNHSDCDGYLSPRICKRVAPRLRELVLMLDYNSENEYDIENGLLLADFMELCAKNNTRLIFC